jgi:hypothetical protein
LRLVTLAASQARKPHPGGDTAVEGAHAGSVTNEPESRAGRRDEIRRRLGSIDARLDELKATRQDDQGPATSRERAESAQRHLAASQAAAGQAITASVDAFRRAALAHERAALHHERAAAAESGDKDEHELRAALHRVAQARDTQRADRVESLVLAEAPAHTPDGTGTGSRPEACQ